jgi:alpha/beta superfamily hydrolase
MFSWNHFFAEKIKKMRQSIDTSWEKALKKDDFF